MFDRVRLIQDQKGSVAIITAVGCTALCAVTALVVDFGSIALQGRRLQGAADLAALSAAQDLDQMTLAATATAEANMKETVGVTVVSGIYRADKDVRPDQRFVAGDEAPNGAKVVLTSQAPLYFGRWLVGRESVPLKRTATAAVASAKPRAAFSIGSRLARLDGGVTNQVLSALTGSNVSLSVMDYEALADADVSLLTFSDALATDLGVTAGDYEGLLDQTVDAGRALKVLERLAGSAPDSALSKLSQAATGVELRFGDLIGIEAAAESGVAGALDVDVSMLDLATAMLEIAGGDRQVALNLGARPGIADLRVSLAIGERPNNSPWITVTDRGEPIVRTAQARLYVKARTSQKLAGLAQINLPILIELASSEAKLNAIACTPKQSVELGVKPGLAKASIGTINEDHLDDFKRKLSPTPATLISVLNLVTLTGKANVEAQDQSHQAVKFSDADIADQKLKSVQARGLVDGVVVSLLRDLDVGLTGLDLGGLVRGVGLLLAPLGPVLDSAINPVLDALGLKLGEADVTVLGVECPDERQGRAALVG